MSTATSAYRSRTSSRRPPRARALRRRAAFLGAVGLAAAVMAVLSPWADKAVQELALPLEHEDIIRQQASEKGLDPSLIAGVIYVESRFREQTSHAGATGLMQLLPSTADYIARRSGGIRFTHEDLATPQINIAYGSWYLRYLLQHYGGDVRLALAAYNAGLTKVDGWWRAARARGQRFDPGRHIPFAETRSYVEQVLAAQAQYRRQYSRELGL